jgi:uncharacterized damage-inducible protein DinB
LSAPAGPPLALVAAGRPGGGDRLIELADACLAEYLGKIALATAELDDDQLWWRANQRSNSIANLMLHLAGNLSLWILHALAGEANDRRRSAEFEARGTLTRSELVERLESVVGRCRAALATLDPETLERVRAVQGYDVDGRAVLFHAVEHMGYHTGQIVLLAKAQLPAERAFEFYPQHRGE